MKPAQVSHKDNKAPLKKKFLQYYSELPVQKLAAAHIGRDEDTIIRWREEDADFADQIEAAKAAWALANSKKVKSVEWLMERIMKDHFKSPTQRIEEKVQQTGIVIFKPEKLPTNLKT